MKDLIFGLVMVVMVIALGFNLFQLRIKLLDHQKPKAPRTMIVDNIDCHLWPLESEVGSPDPHFFWLCPETNTWGLAWNFNDIQPNTLTRSRRGETEG